MRILISLFLALISLNAIADGQDDKSNTFTIDGHLLTRGEFRHGGLPPSDDDPTNNDKYAAFVIGRTRLGLGYKRDNWLQLNIIAQHSGVWGQAGKGSFNLYEAWALLKAENGLFAKLGRQVLAYDDERIIGSDDWTVAALSHDVVKLGYESPQHKIHAVFAFNQNADNTTGGTVYRNGAQPYKTMQTLWYNYNPSKVPLSVSCTFMNIGMQDVDPNEKATRFQQLIGGYLLVNPDRWKGEASYYYQFGKDENNIDISAWMASVKCSFNPSDTYGFKAGYDYLSGDKYFAVPPKNALGLIQHKTIRGFNPVYGSHHKFYGAMDFFYISNYVGGFTPGLQNLYFGANLSPIKNLSLDATYHYFAIAANLDMPRSLGHELEFNASYKIKEFVKLSLGYSFMKGTETMERLKRTDSDQQLHWLWLSVNITPRIFSTRW